jgi:aminopeptidase N
VLTVEAEVADGTLSRFTDPADDAGYLLFTGYPTLAPGLFCCFDQADLIATTTLSLVLPAGWECLANGPVTARPPAGQAGAWRFGPVSGTRPFDLTIAAGPYVEVWQGQAGTGGAVRMSIRRRRSLDGAAPGLDRFAGLARQALEYYERMLEVACPYPKYDIGFVPRLNAMAISIPGLMLVNESLLARMPRAAAGRRGQGGGLGPGADRRPGPGDGGCGRGRDLGARPGGGAGRLPGALLRRGGARTGRP